MVLLVATAWLAVPPIVRAQLESRLTDALDRQTTVESVAFNPFTLSLTIRNLVIADRAGSVPLLAVDEIVANVSAASIWHRAPVFDALKVGRPRVSLARDRDSRYNIQDLIDRALAGPGGPPARFSLNNVEINEGSIAFDDGVTGRKHFVDAIDVGIPFLSSLPYATSIHVTPRIGGAVNGAWFALAGSTTPFSEHRETTFDLDVDALPLASYVVYLPVKPRVDLAGGSLTTRLKIAFVDGEPSDRRLEVRGNARLDGLAIKRRDGSPLAAAEHIAVALDRIDVTGGDARIASVTIDAPTVDVTRLADGTLEWAQPLVERSAPASKPVPPNAVVPAPSWQVSIGKLAVERGTVALADETSAFRRELVDVALVASNLTTRPGEKAHVNLDFASSDHIASFSGEADVEPTVPSATGHFALSRFSLGMLFPYYKSVFAVDVQKGALDLASAFALDAAGNLRLTDGEATLTDLQVALPGNRNPIWRVPQLAARSVDVDVRGRKVTVGEIQSQGAALRLLRNSDGRLEMARLMRTTADTGPSNEAAWRVLARKVALDRVAIDFEDRVPEPAVKVAVRDLAVTATDVGNDPRARSNVTLRTRVGDRGRVAFAGPIAANPLSLSGRLDASGLALVTLKPYVEPRVNVVFTDGTLAAKGSVSVDASDATAVRATWKGDVSVTDFAALDKPTESDLARWKSFSLEGMAIATNPFRASVSRIGIDDFYARVIVYQDGTLNLARLLTPGKSPEPSTDSKPPAPTDAAPAREALPISIGRIDFERGNVNFSDFFVKPNYSANLTDVQGTVSTMSEDLAGEVSIVARVDRTAPVEVQGHIAPFGKELSLDIAAKAHDIDLPALSTYSVKYAGYGIEKGKLTFDVRYQVENRKLTAENHLVLDQLTFGERVESPTATKLPVLLAVALLKDSRGVIDIRLPIGGSLDDPKFSVGGLVIRVIVNLIAKAATAPFALLAAAFGGGEELSTLTFAAGSAELAPEAQKRIDTLGKALADRPGLKLEVGGHADPAGDREALRHAVVDDAIKRAKMKALVREGTAPASIDQVTIAADERNRWLKEAYRDAPLRDRPRNVIGMLKDVPPADMEAMLYANASVDDDALRLLANTRAQAVKDAIAAKGVAGERLFLIAPRVGEDPGGKQAPATLTRVDLSLH